MKNNMKHLITFLFVSLLVFIIFTGCIKKQIENKKIIKYFARATTEQMVIWEKVINQFMEKNPDIKVIIENVPYQEYWSKLLTMSAGGTSPDVIFMESTRLAAFVEKDSLLAVDDLVKKDKEIKINDFYSVALKMSKYKGKLYGLPNDLAIILLYYNQDAFDRAGVIYPKAGWTWNDLIKIGQKLTIDKNNDGVPDQYALTHYPWEIAIYQNNSNIVDDVFKPKKSTFNISGVKEALNFCRDLSYKYKITPPPNQQRDRTVDEMFTSGYSAMTITGHWMIPTYRTIKKFKWNVVVLPKGKKSAGLAYGSCYSIPKGSKNPEQAWRLIKYLASYEGQKVLVSDGFSVPALKSVANSKIFLSPPPVNQKAFLDMIKVGYLKPQTPYYNQLDDIWRNQLDSFWLKQTSVEKVCKIIDKRVDKILQ